MQIITIPHPTLRQTATAIEKVDTQLTSFIKNLEKTLEQARNPKGIALAAPQVDQLWRMFATQHDNTMRTLINPRITDESDERSFGPDENKPYLEGCLSMPGIYGPVPRAYAIKVRYEIVANDELVTKTEDFSDFDARVIQHEIDHLNGILFTDYSLQYDLPIYQDYPDEKELVNADREMIAHLTAFEESVQ
ncbi:MAG: peptide deformylase [Patescibacteria group bacterium]